MTKPISKMTQLILKQPGELTNREVADKLGVQINTVREARRRHNVKFKYTPRDRGLAEKIAAKFGAADAEDVSKWLGCTESYVRRIWREMSDERIS